MQKLLLTSSILLFALTTTGQETFTMVHEILQTRCGGNGCHNGTTATFDVTQSEADLYTDLVNVDPVNPAALAKGNKLIRPGYPTQSFLLRKIAHGISDVLELEQPQEGDHMPAGGAQLEDHEIELFRQWIIFGAPESGNVVDTALINTYYRDGGIDDTYADHEPPAAGEGFQMYMGRLFVPPLTEYEYYMKFDPEIATGIEVTKIETYMPQETHHFVIYSFNPGAETAYVDGLRNAYDLGAQDSHADIKNPIATGPGLWNYELPQGTAYYWPANTVFDMNIHIKNSNPDSILATDMYMNIYTQEAGTTDQYMQIKLFPVLDIVIPRDGEEHVFTEWAGDSLAENSWKIWNLYTHTHKYGTMYDAFEANPDGTKGEMIYDGDYSYEWGFDVGYYRTGPEVTFRYFPDNDLYEIDPRVGIIHEAGFTVSDTTVNSGMGPVEWGLTSDDEMMVLGVQYIEGESLTGIDETLPVEGLQIYPNPTNESFSFSFNLIEKGDIDISVLDMAGRKLATFSYGDTSPGRFSQQYSSNQLGLSAGTYLLQLNINGSTGTKKLMLVE